LMPDHTMRPDRRCRARISETLGYAARDAGRGPPSGDRPPRVIAHGVSAKRQLHGADASRLLHSTELGQPPDYAKDGGFSACQERAIARAKGKCACEDATTKGQRTFQSLIAVSQ